MNKVTITFEGESWSDLENQMCDALGFDKVNPDGTKRYTETVLNPQSLAEIFEEEEAKAEPEPEAPKAPVAPRKPRSVKPPVPAVPVSAAPEPKAPEPEPEPEPELDLPSLDALKGAVTQAVRAAQKGEGSKKILDLLPGFKDRTGLDFVMNATEAHRRALFELIETAGLETV